jgi:hypothetical protein
MSKGIIGKRVEYQEGRNFAQGIVMCQCDDNKWFLVCDDELKLNRVRYDMLTRIILDTKFEKVKKEKTEE